MSLSLILLRTFINHLLCAEHNAKLIMGRQLQKRQLSCSWAPSFILETVVINFHNELNAKRGFSKALMGTQRKGQLMTSVRPGKSFGGSDTETCMEGLSGRGWLSGRGMSWAEGAACASSWKHTQEEMICSGIQKYFGVVDSRGK